MKRQVTSVSSKHQHLVHAGVQTASMTSSHVVDNKRMKVMNVLSRSTGF